MIDIKKLLPSDAIELVDKRLEEDLKGTRIRKQEN